MTTEAVHKYEYVFGKRQFFNLLLGIGLIGFAVFLYLQFEIDSTRIVLIAAFSLLGSIPLLMTLHYFIASKDLIIDIDSRNNNIQISQNGVSSSVNLNELTSVQIHEHKGLGLYEFDFDYAKYIFRNGNYFVVTSFMTNEYFVPAGMEPKLKNEFLPIIWKRTKM